jgi:hypothetical protein
VFGRGFDEHSHVILTLHGASTPKVRTNATLFVSSQELTANITTAADAPGGPYDIEVDGRNGKQGIGTELVDLKAHVFGISPASTEPGEPVTISGINFGTDRGQVIVTFDGVGGFVQSVSNTSIVAVVPHTLAPGTATVGVRIEGTPVPPALNLEVVAPRIIITDISPSAAEWLEQVTISGSGFGSALGQVRVTVGDEEAPVLSVDDTILVVTVPLNAAIGMVPVMVSTTRIPTPEPAQTVLEVIPPRSGPITGAWTVSGEFLCCNVGFGDAHLQLGGSLTLSEGSGGELSGSASVRIFDSLNDFEFAGGPIAGSVDHAQGSFSFTVENCLFEGQVVTSRFLTGIVGLCGDGGGTWQATRQ